MQRDRTTLAFALMATLSLALEPGCGPANTLATDLGVDGAPDASAAMDGAADGGPDAGSVGVVQNGTSGAAADYSCLGHFTPGAAGPSAPQVFHVASLRTTQVAGAVVDLVDPATGVVTGVSATADATGDATLNVPSNALLAWHIDGTEGCPDTCMPMWQFAGLTLGASAVAGGMANPILLFDIDDYVGLQSHVGAIQTDVSGEFVGTVLDCTGAPVSGVTVSGLGTTTQLPLCGQLNSTSVPCVVYFDTATITTAPNVNRTATGTGGLFMVFSVAAGAVSLTANGALPSAPDHPVPLNSIQAFEFNQSVTFGALFPLAN